MPSPDPVRPYRPLLYAGAVLLAIAVILYSGAWMYYQRHVPRVEIGFDDAYSAAGIIAKSVHPNSPAEKAGLKTNDLIVGINGDKANSESSWEGLLYRIWLNGEPGDSVTLTVKRAGQAQPLTITPTFRVKQGEGETRTLAYSVGQEVVNSFPVIFLLVGLPVLFLRVEDRNAWLMTLVFATFITPAGIPNGFAGAPETLRSFLLAYKTVGNALLPGLFYFFFAGFPTPSPIERKVPWLKWALLATVACLGFGGIRHGSLDALPPIAAVVPYWIAQIARHVTGYGAMALGVLSLFSNVLGVSDAVDRRKLKVILWGTAVGVTPMVLLLAAEEFLHYDLPFWITFCAVLLLLLFPLSFAYAVVKHRVMDIPVLLRRSARYFVVERGFVFLIAVLSVGLTLWFGQAFSRHFSAGSKAAIPIGATFGVLVISGATQVHRRVRTRLDHAFFRSSYNAQQILENLAAKTLNVSSREELALLLQQNIGDALHPRSMFVYLRASGAQLVSYAGDPPPEAITLSSTAPEIVDLAERSGPLELMPEEMHGTQLAPLEPECLVPIRGSSDGELQGLAVLGPRLSEESYSTMDKRLLASVASQAGIAMRSITLAERMSRTMEAERRSEQEMQIARQVQSRLLPQQAPSLKTLECAGKCVQTRAVGGDYYDFLDFGSGRLGLVLADISGKGMSAALLMANLQANLRGQYALALEDVPRLLVSVNRLFFKNTETSNYATMFFAVYDDETRTLRYVNCGHNPPVLMRANGDVERLAATATVLGLFEQWDCNVVDCKLMPGDALVIYTDGISEAGEREDGEGEEFGEERLLAVIRKHQQLSASEILDGVLGEVQRFSPDQQADDMTLIAARCR